MSYKADESLAEDPMVALPTAGDPFDEVWPDSDDEVIVVHSSDVHVSFQNGHGQAENDDGLTELRRVIQTTRRLGAAVLILAGDTFENNRLPARLLDRTTELLAQAGLPIVILPGNHDPLTPDSVFVRGDFTTPGNVHVLGLTTDEAVRFPEIELEIWGRPHRDYGDMFPLSVARPRSTRWQIAMAHGHFQPEPIEPARFYGSWLIREADIAATRADYVALGHWNRPARVRGGDIPAYYSGSPDYAGTVNVVRLRRSGAVLVERHQLAESPGD